MFVCDLARMVGLFGRGEHGRVAIGDLAAEHLQRTRRRTHRWYRSRKGRNAVLCVQRDQPTRQRHHEHASRPGYGIALKHSRTTIRKSAPDCYVMEQAQGDELRTSLSASPSTPRNAKTAASEVPAAACSAHRYGIAKQQEQRRPNEEEEAVVERGACWPPGPCRTAG